MPSKADKPDRCPCCDQVIGEDFIAHKASPLHVFNFYIWAFAKRRKALCKDKDGIRLEVNLVDFKNLDSCLKYNNRGKYILEVKPEQLHPEKQIEFRCSIYNDRKEDDVFLTAARTLDACELYSCYDDKVNWMNTGRFIQIKPKERYRGVLIKFKIDALTVGSYKVPFALNLQTADSKTDITLCRSIVINILASDVEEETVDNEYKSPFTNRSWEQNVHIIRAYRNIHHAQNYIIPHKYARSFKHGLREWKTITIEEYEALEYLKRQMEPGYITIENYEVFWHNCLWLEEKVEALMLQSYNMENVTMSLHGTTQLKLEVPGLAEKRPSLIVGDLIRIRVHEDHTGYEGYIKYVENRHIIIEYVDPELLDMIYSNPGTELDVAFQLGRLPLERAHRGVDTVCAKGIKKLLFPDKLVFHPYTQIYKLKDSDFINRRIVENMEQKTAVEKILNCSSQGAPYIVFGPPGTGKTVTIVEAICQILKKTNKKILVCAPANAACDMLASKLIPYCTKKQLIRIHSDSRDKSSIPEQVKGYSNMTADGQFLSVGPRDIGKYRIIVTTLIFVGKYDFKADYVFIDEAAQAKEPEVCVALSMLMNPGGSVVLAGDPMQLGPVVQSTIAKKYGLGISLLERLMETQKLYKNEDPNFISMLKKHFRCHPDILGIPNELFYESKLKAASDNPMQDPVSQLTIYPNIKKLNPRLKIMKLGSGHAIEFCAVSSKERREGRSPSYFNPIEADMVIEYIKTLINASTGFQQPVKPAEIGVITPYIRQVYKIKELLKRFNYRDVEVGSTEAFQGREKRIIIISTVRAQHSLLKYDKKYALGFVKEPKRFNVAITRAVSKLIVIGCPTVLATDEKWKQYIMKCRELECYHGAPYEERTTEKMMEISQRFSSFPNFVAKGK